MVRSIEKVTGFVTRLSERGTTDLLVFRHPHGGVQFPAGTVEVGEDCRDAVRREVAEETGVAGVRLLRHLGGSEMHLDGAAGILAEDAPLLVGPHREARALDAQVSRGSWCRVIGEVGRYSEVVYEELDCGTDSRPIVRFSGWVASTALATTVTRHHFQLVAPSDLPERWSHLAENRYVFDCYWTPLVPKPTVSDSQQAWLDSVYDDLVAYRW